MAVIRLAKAAKEFNVGSSTLIDFLKENGHEIDSKPNTKLTDEMYALLLKEYQSEKDMKEAADQINLGGTRRENVEIAKGEIASSNKKEEELLIKNVTTTPIAPPEVEEKTKEEPAKEVEKVVEEPVKAEEPVVEAKEEPAVEEKKVEEKAKEEPKQKVEKTEKVELEGTTVIGKVDLKPKKKTEKEAPKDKAPVKADTPKEEDKPDKKEEPAKEKETKKAVKEEPEMEMIKTKMVKLDGPKVMGKIELPKEPEKKKKSKDNQKRGKLVASSSEAVEGRKRKRKRIQPAAGAKGKAGTKKDEVKEVSEKEIKEKLKQTMAKLGQSKGSSKRAKLRKQKRDVHAERTEEQEVLEGEDKTLKVTEFISVSELASLMDVAPTDVISKCFSLGVMVSINQRLDAEIIELVSSEYGYEVSFLNVEDQTSEQEEEEEDDPADLKDRAPIVTIMGHVDHGKTSLLDYVREANVVAGEKGGITQHIGAYEVTLQNGKTITFLDTPGHEAFTAMRARGAKVTDVVVVIVAADDRVMPQTKEAISHAQAAGVPIVFAINKIDRPSANADKIKEELSAMNLLVEEWGGKIQSEDISAKTGLNVDNLLEKILLESELLELKANPNRLSKGTVIEATLDKGRGFVTTILVQNGTLKVGDNIVAGNYHGRIKAMFNERGDKLKEAGPSSPAVILGLSGAPQAGDTFKETKTEGEAKDIATKRAQISREQGIRTKKHITLDEIGRRLALGTFKELNVIVKGDVDGSIEALSDSLEKLSTEEVVVKIIHKGVGAITETDVTLASASDAIIIGFQVRPSANARKIADNDNIEIRLYSVIYDAIEEIKAAMEGLLEPTVEEKVTCNVEVREVFKITRIGTVAGSYVTDGKITNKTKVRLIRDGIVVYTGEISALKRFKDDVKEVASNYECGISIKNYNDIKVGDVIEGYEEVEIKRTL